MKMFKNQKSGPSGLGWVNLPLDPEGRLYDSTQVRNQNLKRRSRIVYLNVNEPEKKTSFQTENKKTHIHTYGNFETYAHSPTWHHILKPIGIIVTNFEYNVHSKYKRN